MDHLESPAFPSPGLLFGLLILYLSWHVILRVFLSSSADLDEAEQLMLCQKLCWGYGPQPPLYSWLQAGFFAVFGQSIFALALFKNLLLLGLFAFTYANTRLITGLHLCAAAATLSLLFLPQVAWESQRDLTHSVLASTMAVATLYCFLRLHREPRIRWFLLFGLSTGAGMLSKYNFGLWIVGLLIAALTIPKLRSSILDKRMALALAVCALMFLPHALWILDHRDLALSAANKFRIQAAIPWVNAFASGLGNMLRGLASFLGPLALLYALLFFKSRKLTATTTTRPGLEYEQLLWRAWFIVLLILVVLVACSRTTAFRGRWLQPMLVSIPVAAIAALRQRLNPSHLRWMAAASGLVMLAVSIVIPSRVIFAESLQRDEPLNRPYLEVAERMRPLLTPSTLIIAETPVLAGNLRLAFPDRTVVTPRVFELFPHQDQRYLMVWDATRQDLPSNIMRQWAASFTPPDFSRVQFQYVTAPYRRMANRQMRLAVAFAN